MKQKQEKEIMKMTAIIKVKSEIIETYSIEDVIFVNYVDGKLILVNKLGDTYKYDSNVGVTLC